MFKKIDYFLIITLFVFSCSGDETSENTEIDEIDLQTSDFTTEVYENINTGEILGIIQGETSGEETISFELSSESAEGAFKVDEETGELTVLNHLHFNHENNPILSAEVKVSIGDISEISHITVNVVEVTIDVDDFITDLPENPSVGMEIGSLEASTNNGELVYSINNQSVEGAFSVNQNGVLSVLDPSAFSIDKNQIITGSVTVSNGHLVANANINLTLVPMNCNSSQQSFSNFAQNLVSVQGYSQQTLNYETQSYSFYLSKNATICSVGYKGYKSPYSITILDDSGVVLCEQINMSFSSSNHEYKSFQCSLAPGNYTIERRKENYNNLSETKGDVFVNSSGNIQFPIVYNNFITITGSEFSSIKDIALPYISIAFN